MTDCLDGECDAVCDWGMRQAFTFDTNAEGFVYKDDLFRGTTRPAYASGSYDTGNGLSVILGGIDASWVLNGRSGGWTKTFEVFDAGAVTISIGYRLTIAGEYESDEYSQVLVSVDGNLIGAGGKDYLLELRGTDVNTPLIDSGWRTATLQMTLSQGVHTLSFGVWNNKKTGALEVTQAYFDDIEIRSEMDMPLADEVIYRINSGGPTVITDGLAWEADQFFSGSLKTFCKDEPIESTGQDVLYQSERYGKSFKYSMPVEPGIYMLKLHFAEIYFASSGKRVFNVFVENDQAGVANFDIVSEVGTKKALIKTIRDIYVNDGSLDIDFESLVDNAKISAIEVILLSINI